MKSDLLRVFAMAVGVSQLQCDPCAPTPERTTPMMIEPYCAANAPPIGQQLSDEICSNACAHVTTGGYYWQPCRAEVTAQDAGVASCGDGGAGDASSQFVIVCEEVTFCSVGGRRPHAGSSLSAFARGIGAQLLRQSQEEYASIIAFDEIAHFLREHRAPSALVQRARRAIDDERRHARSTAKLARSFGARGMPLTVATRTRTNVATFATHNAREGCVRESYGAALAHFQAKRATDLRVRRTFRRIARDESQHAVLSWDLAAWVRSKLSLAESALAETALREEIASLSSLPDHSPAPEPGLPSRDEALAIFRKLHSLLWDAKLASA